MDSNKNLSHKYFHSYKKKSPENIELMGENYKKVDDLRYGTNPHQTATIYKTNRKTNQLNYQILKSGKNGLSQTNLEDVHYALNILKYYDSPTAVVMKHLNPSGASTAFYNEDLKEIYINARETDPRAAFGGVVGLNKKVDENCAKEIMSSVIEIVLAPSFSEKAIKTFHNFDYFKRNRHIRLLQVNNINNLAKYLDDKNTYKEIKMLLDGSVIISDAYLTRIKNKNDFIIAFNKNKDLIECKRKPEEQEYKDLLFAWHINLSVRSNGIVIVKNGKTLAIGTGEQDRIGAIEKAIEKSKRQNFSLKKAVISSDGFFPFRDSIDLLYREGITAIVQPGGSINDYEIIKACNDNNIAMVFTNERCFSHH